MREREDDGVLVEGRHVADDLGVEDPGHGGRSDQHRGLQRLDDVAELLHGRVLVREGRLVLADAALGSVLHDKATGVLQPDLLDGLLAVDIMCSVY